MDKIRLRGWLQNPSWSINFCLFPHRTFFGAKKHSQHYSVRFLFTRNCSIWTYKKGTSEHPHWSSKSCRCLGLVNFGKCVLNVDVLTVKTWIEVPHWAEVEGKKNCIESRGCQINHTLSIFCLVVHFCTLHSWSHSFHLGKKLRSKSKKRDHFQILAISNKSTFLS